MMLDAETWAKDRGFNCFYLYSPKINMGFYRKCGYSVDDDDELGYTTSGFDMKKDF